MNTLYTYRSNLGIMPLLMKTITVVMFGIVLVRTIDTGINKIIIIAGAAYFIFAIFQFLNGLKHRPLKLFITGKGIEYTSTDASVSINWKNVKQVNEYYVPVMRRTGYFRIDIHSVNGEVIWFTNNMLLSSPPKSEAANYNEIKRVIKNKVSKDRIKLQIIE